MNGNARWIKFSNKYGMLRDVCVHVIRSTLNVWETQLTKSRNTETGGNNMLAEFDMISFQRYYTIQLEGDLQWS